MNPGKGLSLLHLPAEILTLILSILVGIDKRRGKLVCREFYFRISGFDIVDEAWHVKQIYNVLIGSPTYRTQAHNLLGIQEANYDHQVVEPIANAIYSYSYSSDDQHIMTKPRSERRLLELEWMLSLDFDNEALVAAAQRGDLDQFKTWMERLGCFEDKVKALRILDDGDPQFGTSLYVACYFGRLNVAQYLLSFGANVNVSGGLYGNPLQAASSKGHFKLVELLIAKNADVDLVGGYYGTALQAAAFQGSSKIVTLLLDNKAVINIFRGKFGSPLSAAVIARHKEVAELLIKSGADVNADGYYGNPLTAATLAGDKDMVQLLIDKGANVNGVFRLPVVYGPQSVLDLLIDNGADINIMTLWSACRDGKLEFTKFLVERGTIEYLDGEVFRAAVQSGNPDLLDFLLLQKRCESCLTEAVLEATVLNDEIALNKLLDQGGEVESNYGSLIGPACNNNIRMIKLLLAKGASINESVHLVGIESLAELLFNRADIDTSHLGPLACACLKGHVGIAEWLLENGAHIDKAGPAIFYAVEHKQEAAVRLLIRRGANVNVMGRGQGGKKISALRVAVIAKSVKIVNLLLDAGADVNTDAPIEAAASVGNNELVELLLNAGAYVNEERPYSPYNALMSAKAACFQSTVTLLLQKNAKVPMNLDNCLLTAIRTDNLQMVKYLFEEGARIEDGRAIDAAAKFGQLGLLNQILQYSCKQEYLVKALKTAILEWRPERIVQRLFKQVLKQVKATEFIVPERLVLHGDCRILRLLVLAGCCTTKKNGSLLEIAVKEEYNSARIRVLLDTEAADLAEEDWERASKFAIKRKRFENLKPLIERMEKAGMSEQVVEIRELWKLAIGIKTTVSSLVADAWSFSDSDASSVSDPPDIMLPWWMKPP